MKTTQFPVSDKKAITFQQFHHNFLGINSASNKCFSNRKRHYFAREGPYCTVLQMRFSLLFPCFPPTRLDGFFHREKYLRNICICCPSSLPSSLRRTKKFSSSPHPIFCTRKKRFYNVPLVFLPLLAAWSSFQYNICEFRFIAILFYCDRLHVGRRERKWILASEESVERMRGAWRLAPPLVASRTWGKLERARFEPSWNVHAGDRSFKSRNWHCRLVGHSEEQLELFEPTEGLPRREKIPFVFELQLVWD